MLFGAILVLSWLILLIRYPSKALPISLGALIGLGLVASWVLWQESRENRHLAHLELRLDYAPERCPADRPLALNLKNDSEAALLKLQWPTLRSGYRASTLEFRAERLQGSFAH